jgi:hypothetical protein
MKIRAGPLMDEPIVRPGWIVSPIFFGLGLSLIFFSIVFLARANVFTFPLPNEDDNSFFLPAWNLAVHGTLRAPVVNAPDGIFWMPDGLYVWLALFLRIFEPTIEVARTVCQLTTATAAVLLVIAYSRLCGSRGFALLCGALLVSPGVIFTANIVRMESLILLIFATAHLLHSCERRIAAVAMFFLAVVVHPALLLGATLYAVGIFWADVALPWYSRSGVGDGPMAPAASSGQGLKPKGARIQTILIVASAAVAIALESAYVFNHLQLFHQHMAFQIARKAARNPIRNLLSRRGLSLTLEVVFTSAVVTLLHRHPHGWRVFVRELLPVFLMALGLSTYATFGREIPYNVYSYAVVPATLCCLTYRLISLPLSEEAGTRVLQPLAS